MVFKKNCVFVLWMTAASALEGLKYSTSKVLVVSKSKVKISTILTYVCADNYFSDLFRDEPLSGPR